MTLKNPEYKYKGLTCLGCGVTFDSKSRNKKQRFCTKSCARIMIPNGRRFGDIPAWNKGAKISSMSGKKFTKEHRQKISLANSGENAPNWKGGRTPEMNRLRKIAAYREWRTSVFERDNYTCQLCFTRSSRGKRVKLNADHIKQFAFYPEARFDVSNGRTLCEPCHRKTPTWGYTGKKATLESTGQTYEELKTERDNSAVK